MKERYLEVTFRNGKPSAALAHHDLQETVTGKFTMTKREDQNMTLHFEIHVELKAGVTLHASLKKQLRTIITDSLTARSSEYRELARMSPRAAQPTIHLWPFQHPTYFKPGWKQQWVHR
ncbi:MAG: hypothetical protein HZA21_02540 [Nitrospirae bacterium]|nr:hypothetical protein [Nitrospirota bacterium]